MKEAARLPSLYGSLGKRMSQPLANPRWEKFAQFRAFEGLNCTNAYRAMGGTAKNAMRQGYKIDRQPVVKARIRDLLEQEKEKRLAKILYTREDVLRGLLLNIDEARNCIKHDKNGAVLEGIADPLTQIRLPARFVDFKAVNQAYELLGRELGMFPKTANISHNSGDPLDGLTLQEVLESVRVAIWEASDGQIDFDPGQLLTALGGSPGQDGGQQLLKLPVSQDGDVQALPEAAGVPRDGEDEAREDPAGGQPAGQDAGGQLRDGMSHHGPVPEVVDGEAVRPAGEVLGGGGNEPEDAGRSSVEAFWEERTLGYGDDPQGDDTGTNDEPGPQWTDRHRDVKHAKGASPRSG